MNSIGGEDDALGVCWRRLAAACVAAVNCVSTASNIAAITLDTQVF